jgi:hypothetical protein
MKCRLKTMRVGAVPALHVLNYNSHKVISVARI